MWLIITWRRGGMPRLLGPDKYWIDRYTDRGESAVYWQRRPYGGRREFQLSDILFKGEKEEAERVLLELLLEYEARKESRRKDK